MLAGPLATCSGDRPDVKRLAWIAGPCGLALLLILAVVAACFHAAPLLFRALGIAFGAATVVACAYTGLAAVLIRRYFARQPAEAGLHPAVSVLKPLHGEEWALLRNLMSFCEQDYPGAVQFVFGVADGDDPALKTVDELRRLHPEADVATVVDSRLHGSNRKVSNTINMLPHARHGILVFADSDVGAGPDYLNRIVAELQRPGVGLVTFLYRGEPDPGFWPRLSALATNTQFLPAAVAGLSLGLARPCFGQTIAMRRETLERIGGYAPFANLLAEDYAIGMAVRRLGERVAIPPLTISHACAESSLRELVAHELRWTRTIRAADPVGNLASALAHPFALAVLTIVLSGPSGWGLGLAAAAVGFRLILAMQTGRALGRPQRDLWLLPFWDLLSFGIFAAGHLTSNVRWRGFDYRVDFHGRLSSGGGK